VELLDDSEDDENESTNNIMGAPVKKEGKTECAVSNIAKAEVRASKSCGSRTIANETINLLDDSDDDSDYDDDDNIYHDIRCVVAKTGKLGLVVEKVLDGFFVTDITEDSQIKEKIFLGDILKSIDGKRLNKLNLDQFTKTLQESKDKQKRRIYILRPKVIIKAKAGRLGLSLTKVPKGFIVTEIDKNSQLDGKILKDDILTSIDGARLSALDDQNIKIEVNTTSFKKHRRICILRKRKES